MRLAAAACGFAILVCVAVVGAVLSKSVSVSVSAPAPEIAATPAKSAKPVAVRTVNEVTDSRPLYPDYQPTVRPNVSVPAAVTPAPIAVSTTGQSSAAVQPAAVQPIEAPASPEPQQSAAPAQPAEPTEPAATTARRSCSLRTPPRRLPLRARRLLPSPARAIPMRSASLAWSRSTPPAAPASGSSISKIMTSCAKGKWC